MSTRYFSPQAIHYSANLKTNPSPSSRLKWIGSTSKLHSANSVLLCESERRIGSYHYDVTRQIGSGYSSKVFKGKSTKDNIDCAVKVIQLKKYSESSLKMLDNQIQILRTLEHPNIIKCFDIYKTSTHCFIITEYCCNGDLLGYIARLGKLQESVAVEIMSEIIQGVKYLMKKGILHRDLKPANILNNKKNWKIADFGFAIYAEGEIKSKYNVGTPLYMPLQALVKNIYSPSSDIFSVGVIFYELITGITPWQCKNQKELIKKMSNLPYVLSERFKITATNRNLLEKLCSLDSQSRLAREQFLVLKLKKGQNPQVEQKQSSSEVQPKLVHNISAVNLFSSKSVIIERQQLDDRTQTKNNHILINQLQYCRFIYYLTRNLTHLLVSPKSKNKLSLIIYKHLQRLIKNLADDSQNWFHLKSWDIFKQSKKYYTTLLTMKEYCIRYQKDYLNFLKKSQLAIIRQINKEINDNSPGLEAFTLNFYRNLMKIIALIIRQGNHNLTLTMNEPPTPLTPKLCANIQALKSLLSYYNLLQLSLNEFQNYEIFQKKSDIKVIIDYQSNNNIKIQQFYQLRQQLKFI